MSTAYVTDTRFDAHTMINHPEHAGRLQAIRRRLDDDGLTGRFESLEPRAVDDDAVYAAHTQRYVAQLQRTSELSSVAMMGLDTYVTPQSYDLALLAAGGVLVAVDAVLRGEADNALAAVRPPGHHATPSQGMGFCLLNNVAIAARHAQRAHGLERVVIVDYDVHHGNGTQDILYDDPAALYISTHQSPLYPGTGAVGETGQGAGTGHTLNIPLPPGVGDAGYRRVFDEVVLPAIRRYVPELILVSVGFDAHWNDPLANMQLTLHGYDGLARSLLAAAGELCAGRIVFVSEGGYNLQVLSHGWANIARAALGDPAVVDPIGPAPRREPPVDALMSRVQQIHKLI